MRSYCLVVVWEWCHNAGFFNFVMAYGKVGKMETEMETEMENWNGNTCTVVSNYWTGLLDVPMLPLLVRLNVKLNVPNTCLSSSQYRTKVTCIFDKLKQISFEIVIDASIKAGNWFLFKISHVSALLIFSLQLIKYARNLWLLLTRGEMPDQAQEQVIGWICTFSFCPTIKEGVWVSPVHYRARVSISVFHFHFHFHFHFLLFHMPGSDWGGQRCGVV